MRKGTLLTPEKGQGQPAVWLEKSGVEPPQSKVSTAQSPQMASQCLLFMPQRQDLILQRHLTMPRNDVTVQRNDLTIR
jgi:hypothetical protein